MISRIQSIDGEVRIVMEATGVYHLLLLSRFKETGLFVSVINPLAMKKYGSVAIRKGKTDKLDAGRQCIIIGRYFVFVDICGWLARVI